MSEIWTSVFLFYIIVLFCPLNPSFFFHDQDQVPESLDLSYISSCQQKLDGFLSGRKGYCYASTSSKTASNALGTSVGTDSTQPGRCGFLGDQRGPNSCICGIWHHLTTPRTSKYIPEISRNSRVFRENWEEIIRVRPSTIQRVVIWVNYSDIR